MNKSILITGVGGTGKSSVSDELNRLGYKSIGIEGIDGLFTMINQKTGKPFKNYNNTDLEKVKQGDWICDIDQLQLIISNNSEGIVFYCGSASNHDDIIPLFDKIILLRTSQKILRERLSNRIYNDFGRTTEVQEWIFTWKSWWENNMIESGAIVIDASLPLKEVANKIIRSSEISI